MVHTLDQRQLATVLAALRYWQREGLFSSGREYLIASDGGTIEPLGPAEIDALCESLNGSDGVNTNPVTITETNECTFLVPQSDGEGIIVASLPPVSVRVVVSGAHLMIEPQQFHGDASVTLSFEDKTGFVVGCHPIKEWVSHIVSMKDGISRLAMPDLIFV